MRRITILRLAKKLLINETLDFMCISLKSALQLKGFNYCKVNIEDIFPEFNINIAKNKFNAFREIKNIAGPWWDNVNKKDRIAYFDYLIDFYKDDKTDIKKEFKQWLR